MGIAKDGSDAVAVGYVGDGASSEGDFHEGANLAAVMRAPAILFVQNNGWAISVPTRDQTAGEIWRRAEGYGMPGVRVDGNDVLAVYRATADAVARARRGEGPTLIEALTYRIGAHSTADDAGRYRDDAEVERARAFDPIARFRTWMLANGQVDDATVSGFEQEADAFVGNVREELVVQGPPPAEWMFDWAFAEPPAALERQRREALG
jgi:pyruvate dehydrogenase E1 component alpha subunit